MREVAWDGLARRGLGWIDAGAEVNFSAPGERSLSRGGAFGLEGQEEMLEPGVVP
jgi:hypothetical protein